MKEGLNMQYYNLKIAIFLKNNLQNYEIYEKIGNLISFAMLRNQNLKELHEKNIYKNIRCVLSKWDYFVKKENLILGLKIKTRTNKEEQKLI